MEKQLGFCCLNLYLLMSVECFLLSFWNKGGLLSFFLSLFILFLSVVWASPLLIEAV